MVGTVWAWGVGIGIGSYRGSFLEQYGNRICNRKQHRDVVTPNEQWSKLLQGVIGDYIGDEYRGY